MASISRKFTLVGRRYKFKCCWAIDWVAKATIIHDHCIMIHCWTVCATSLNATNVICKMWHNYIAHFAHPSLNNNLKTLIVSTITVTIRSKKHSRGTMKYDLCLCETCVFTKWYEIYGTSDPIDITTYSQLCMVYFVSILNCFYCCFCCGFVWEFQHILSVCIKEPKHNMGKMQST